MNTVAARTATLALAAFSITWFAILCAVAVSRQSPFVFSDEAGYLLPVLFGADASNYAKWSILGAYPSYLYFWLYSLLPVSEIHTSAKLLNAAFIAATAAPAYALARRYLSASYAAAFAAIVIMAPISSFVRYVMPEPVYFFGFWLIVWAVLSSVERATLCSAILGGGLIGLLSLIKPHALAISLAFGTFFFIRNRFKIRGLVYGVAQFVVFYAVHILVGRFLTGVWSWSLFGSLYGGLWAGSHIDVWPAVLNLTGHVFALLVLIAIPLELTVCFLFRNHSPDRGIEAVSQKARLYDLGLLACCLLATMVAMTVYFSQSVYQINPVGENVTRLHGRYYLYVFPLFWLFLLGLWRSDFRAENRPLLIRNLYVSSAIIFVAASVVGLAFEVGAVDFADLTLFRHFRGPVLSVVMLSIGILALSRLGRGLSNSSRLVAGAIGWWVAVNLMTTTALLSAGFGRGFFHGGPIDG